MSSVPCGMGNREDGMDTSSFYHSSSYYDRSKVKVSWAIRPAWSPAFTNTVRPACGIGAPKPFRKLATRKSLVAKLAVGRTHCQANESGPTTFMITGAECERSRRHYFF